MRILLKFTLLSFMTGNTSFIVPGYSGGTVIIYCHYNNQEERNGKYFCVRKTTLSCKDQIRSGSQNTWEHSGRFSLYDDTEENYFMVVIRQLTRQDEGIYWCGEGMGYLLCVFPFTDKCCDKSVTETVDLGGEDPIICNYPEKYENSIKYFCKEDNDSKIYYEIISAASTSAKSGRFSLTDNRREKRFTVTISNLTEYDTGTYWCGVENRRTEKLYISLITKYTQQSNQASRVFFCVCVCVSDTLGVVLLCVSLVVLLLVISLPVVSRWKANKRTGEIHTHTHPHTDTHTQTHTQTSHGEGYYEEIQERPQQSETGDARDAPTAISATADLPRNPSGSLHYASVNFHKDPSCPNEATTTISKEDTSSCDYATVNVDQSLTYPTVNHPQISSEAPPIYYRVVQPKDT
uniref:Immunoglobulin V-set domain-containing protein n=1 Tax=Esox lucius TaxID=8010 RepID=A0A3P9A0T5_ESOLU